MGLDFFKTEHYYFLNTGIPSLSKFTEGHFTFFLAWYAALVFVFPFANILLMYYMCVYLPIAHLPPDYHISLLKTC